MNKAFLIGRTTKDITVAYAQNGQLAIASFTLAVNRAKKDEADFITCKAFGKTAEALEKYVKKGDRLAVAGHIQTGSYEKDGHKVYTTDLMVDSIEFLETKRTESAPETTPNDEGFMDVPAELTEELPFV